MPRTINLHSRSVLIGVGIALLGFVAIGQTTAPNRPPVDYLSMLGQVAHPRDWVVIREGDPFVVPANTTFVLTGLGGTLPDGTHYSFSSWLSVDGVNELSAGVMGNSTMIPVALGFSVASGSTVEAVDNWGPSKARAWGFLVPSTGSGYERLKVPGPSSWVVIKEGSGYVVPDGKILVVTAAGRGNLLIQGVVEHSITSHQIANALDPPGLPVGLRARAGQLVEAVNPLATGGSARAWGYLVDA